MIEHLKPDGSSATVEFETISYRHADEILNAKLAVRRELESALAAVKGVPVKQGPDGLTAHLVSAFKKRDWQTEVPVAENQKHEQRFDLFKERVAVEIEFSRYEFVYRDYFRFLSAYNADKIDVGVLLINADPGQGGRVKHKHVAPSLDRVKDDLAWLRPTLTVPLWIVALK